MKSGFVTEFLDTMDDATAAAQRIFDERAPFSDDPEKNMGGKDILSVLLNIREKTEDDSVRDMLSDKAMIGHIVRLLSASVRSS